MTAFVLSLGTGWLLARSRNMDLPFTTRFPAGCTAILCFAARLHLDGLL